VSSSAEFQALIFATLTGNGAVMAIAGGVYDRVPEDPFADKTAYISIGQDDATDDDAEGIDGIELTLQIDIWSKAVGAVECRRLRDVVRRALHHQSLQLSANALADTRVALSQVFPDPDGLTTHGIVQVTARIEEA
jgi:hypothetical protein